MLVVKVNHLYDAYKRAGIALQPGVGPYGRAAERPRQRRCKPCVKTAVATRAVTSLIGGLEALPASVWEARGLCHGLGTESISYSLR